MSPVASRVSQADPSARPGRQAPLSGRRGALWERTVDTIAFARRPAEKKVAP
jgi:hypothetical protein